MKDNKTYYGTDNSQTITYLEFGEIDIANSQKKIWNFQLHQKAYDWLMLGRYANDLQTAVTMQEKLKENNLQEVFDLYNKEVHHEDEASLNLAKILALAVIKDKPVLKTPSFYELGQTIFGCIEGMEFYVDLLKSLKVNDAVLDLKQVEWYGVDISEMFNQLSVTFHREYKVYTMTEQSGLPEKMDVFFSKGITLLYAVRNMKELFTTLNKGRIAIFDYSFSLGEVVDTTIGSGKTVRYLNFNEFLSELKKTKEVMYVKTANSKIVKDKNRVWLDCVYGEKQLCEDYIKLDMSTRRQLAQSLTPIKNISRFLNNDTNPEWVLVENYNIK